MTAIEIAEQLAQGRAPKRSGTGWMVRCPAHDDHTESLWVNDGDNGGVVLKCHAECSFENIVAASRIERNEFFAERSDWDSDDMWTPKGPATAAYPYPDENGRLLYTIMRLPNKDFIPWHPDPTAAHGRAWNLNGVTRRVPYRLPEVLKGIEAGNTVVICEGEKDVHTLVRNGFVATCNSGGAGKFLPEFASYFKGAKVVVVPDQDSPGKDHAEQVATILHEVAAELRVVDLPGLTGEKGSRDATDWFEAGNDRAEFIKIARAAEMWTPPEAPTESANRSEPEPSGEVDWGDPRPLPTYRQAAPFCSGVLGAVATSMADAVARDLKTPIDYSSLAALGVCSAVIGGAVVVEVTETWQQPVNLYINVLAAPGSGKSPALKAMRRVLDRVEEDRSRRMEPTIREAASRHRVLEKRLQNLEAEAANPKTSDVVGKFQEVDKAARELAAVVVPNKPRIYTKDATPEALVGALATQAGRFSVITDEGSEFYELAARYAKGGKANLGVYIAGKDGDRHIEDRKHDGVTVIERVTLTVCLFGQPIVLDVLAQDRQAKGRGLLARMLWSYPPSNVGWESVDECPTPRHISDAWESLIVGLATEAENANEPIVLRMSQDAKRHFLDWTAQWRPRRRASTGDLAPIVEWASKLQGELARLAGNLHALQTGTLRGVISDETMIAAIELVDYFISHAFVVFGEMEAPQTTKDAASVLRWLEARSLSRSTTRDIATSKDWTADRTREALVVLALYDWVRAVPHDSSKGGRPSEQWEVKLQSAAQNGAEPPSNRNIAPICSADSEVRETSVQLHEQAIDFDLIRERMSRAPEGSDAAEVFELDEYRPDKLEGLSPLALSTLIELLDEAGV